MPDSNPPIGKPQRPTIHQVFYHITTVGDPNYRLALPGDDDYVPGAAAADPNRVIASWTEETPMATHHYRVIRADITIRPRGKRKPPPDAPPAPSADGAGEAPAGA